MNPWESATSALRAPLVAVDLDAFDANADDLVRRAGGLPIRVASKSVRCRSLLDRVLARPGFAGVMAYAVAEAVWLATAGVRDVFVAYPSADVEALRAVATDPDLRREVTVTVDSVEHVRFLRDALGDDVAGLGVALDVDASLRVGPVHLGVRRSPTRTPAEALAVVRAAAGVGLDVRGVMFYDAQVAGLPDAGPHVRLLKRRSVRDLHERRAAVVDAVRGEADLRFVNGGGTGSLHRFADDTAVTELAAGSGLYAPTLFDGYDDFSPRPAMAFALPVVRRPAPGGGHGLRRRVRRERGAGMVPGAVAGAPRARARAHRGGRRGAVAPPRSRRRRARHRRPGVDAGSQGGRAARAVRHGAPRACRRARRQRPVLPRRGAELRMTSWRNWAGNVVAAPEEVQYVATVDGVVDAVRRAADRRLTVRVAGAGHSFTPLVATDGLLLNVDRLSGVLSRRPRATAGAGAGRDAPARAEPGAAGARPGPAQPR